MARNTPKAAPKAARTPKGAPVANAATVAAPVTPATNGPRLVIVRAASGRPDADYAATEAAAFAILSDALKAYRMPPAPVAPRNANPRIRAAYAAVAAEQDRALALARAAVANGRARVGA